MEMPPPSSAPTPAYRDRRTGLMLFGVFEIILGVLSTLMIPLMIFGQVMAAKKQGHPFDTTMLASTAGTFVVLAVGFIWLGIGSCQAKRWARALLLCLGWIGLCVGAISLIFIMASLGSMDSVMQQSGRELPSGALLIGKIIGVSVVVFMYVIIPGALVLFYRSRHVKLTCEQHDPVERWTDRCPLPVLALCIMQAYGAVSLILMSKFSGALPLFGLVLSGWTARVFWFGFAAFFLWAAWGFYRLNRLAWLAYTAVLSLSAVSTLVTFLHVDLADYYRVMGLPEWQIKQVAANPLFQGHNFAWCSALGSLLFLSYLMFLRRYFAGPRSSHT